jgi:hypothetical protein
MSWKGINNEILAFIQKEKGLLVFVEEIKGENFNFHSIKLKEKNLIIPSTRKFTIFKFKNIQTNKMRIFRRCDYPEC